MIPFFATILWGPDSTATMMGGPVRLVGALTITPGRSSSRIDLPRLVSLPSERSSLPNPHTSFVNNTRSILLERLQYSSALPVGAWQNRFTRPDILVLQEPLFGRPPIEGKKWFQGFYTHAHMVECKVDSNDLKKAPYQLLLASLSFSGQGMLDLHHGGLRPSLAVPNSLKESMEAEGSFSRAVSIFRELNFGLFVVDQAGTGFRRASASCFIHGEMSRSQGGNATMDCPF